MNQSRMGGRPANLFAPRRTAERMKRIKIKMNDSKGQWGREMGEREREDEGKNGDWGTREMKKM